MKVLIEIDDKDYADIMSDSERNLNHYERLIKKGVPLPKGHGRLIDADTMWDSYHSNDYDFYEALNDAPTIIEADKEIQNE